MEARRGDALIASSPQNSVGSRKQRIPRSDWPGIRRRYEDGEAQTDIAREYGVTPAAISYAVKKARALAQDAQGVANEASFVASPSDESAGSDPVLVDGEQPGISPNEAYHSEGAKRLAEASARACEAFDGQQKGKEAEAIKTAIHDIRRALAAIEIELAKGVPSGRSEAPAPAPSDHVRGTEPEQSRNAIAARVKFFDQERGFGFVVPESGGDDIYVNAKTLAEHGYETLAPSQKVLVTIKPGRRGPEVAELELVG